MNSKPKFQLRMSSKKRRNKKIRLDNSLIKQHRSMKQLSMPLGRLFQYKKKIKIYNRKKKK